MLTPELLSALEAILGYDTDNATATELSEKWGRPLDVVTAQLHELLSLRLVQRERRDDGDLWSVTDQGRRWGLASVAR